MKALERKNSDLEKDHARMITVMGRVVNSQDKQLKHQRFEMGEQERRFQQVMELKETEMKELKELWETELKEERRQSQEMKELDVKKVKEHDAKVHKLEEDNKVLKSQVESLKVDSKET